MYNRFFLRPFFNDFDAFFPLRRALRPTYRVRFTPYTIQEPQYETKEPEAEEKSNPHTLFEQFFKEHQPKTQEQKDFFKKNYPEEVKDSYDPYKVLQLQENASMDKVKDAYRKLALKYHPKNDASEEAATKFADIAKAYESILEGEKSKQVKKYGFNSFFDEFEREIDEMFYPKRTKEVKAEEKSKEKYEASKQTKDEKTNEKDNYGVLYSESSHYESVNGQQTKYVAQKVYKKDGKLLKVTREQKLKDDGNIQITETHDNGEQVKKKMFLQEKGTKKLLH